MAQAKQGDTVKVHYTGKLSDGFVFDTSSNREPLQFVIGKGELIAGFEQAVCGMEIGTTKTITIIADQAYGPYRKERVFTVEKSKFPANIKPVVGQQLELRQQNLPPVIVTILDVTDTHVTLDANHPLAGKDLIFEIQLIEVIA